MKRILRINVQFCKGCGICVAFCPRKALELKSGKVSLAAPERCVLCGLCEQRCPDYAIFIEKECEEDK